MRKHPDSTRTNAAKSQTKARQAARSLKTFVPIAFNTERIAREIGASA